MPQPSYTQAYGRSPVCVRACLLRLSDREKCLPQPSCTQANVNAGVEGKGKGKGKGTWNTQVSHCAHEKSSSLGSCPAGADPAAAAPAVAAASAALVASMAAEGAARAVDGVAGEPTENGVKEAETAGAERRKRFVGGMLEAVLMCSDLHARLSPFLWGNRFFHMLRKPRQSASLGGLTLNLERLLVERPLQLDCSKYGADANT